jgi:hypothetical protein
MEQVYEAFGYTVNRVGLDLGMCLVIGTVLRVIGFVLLIGLNRQKQI